MTGFPPALVTLSDKEEPSRRLMLTDVLRAPAVKWKAHYRCSGEGRLGCEVGWAASAEGGILGVELVSSRHSDLPFMGPTLELRTGQPPLE